MVSVIQDQPLQIDSKEDTTITMNDQANALFIRDEVSIRDRIGTKEVSDYSSEEEAHQGERFYDASDELEDYQEQDPIVIQLKDGREIEIPDSSPIRLKRGRSLRQTRSRGQRVMPEFRNKSHYLVAVIAKDCVKDKIRVLSSTGAWNPKQNKINQNKK